MRIAVLTIAFNESRWIKGCIGQFNNQYYHQVLVSEKPWHGECEPDDTAAVALKYGAHVIVGTWTNETEQRNYGLDLLRDFDWVIICDADERYTVDGMEQLEADLLAFNDQPWAVAIGAPVMPVYWKTPDYQIANQDDCPVVAIRPSESFDQYRAYNGFKNLTYAILHHFSYVRTDEEMWCKINAFAHADEFDARKWYDEVWTKWEPSMENIHPVVPQQFKSAVWDPCPEELRRYLP